MDVLVSTMNQEGYDLINKMNIESNAIIINQNNSSLTKNISTNGNQVKWINSEEKGLSRSRNMAVRHSRADVCLIADDDLVFVKGYKEKILDQFERNPIYDVIAFQVEGIEREFKKYYKKPRKLNCLTIMKVSSVEIAFRRESILNAGITFNEMFGSGAQYFAGEESIFLSECLRKGLKIKYVDIKIADLHIGKSTWFEGFNTDYFFAKGAIFTAMSKRLSIPYIIQFAIRKYSVYSNQMPLIHALQLMLNGRKQYLLMNNQI